MNTDTKPRAYPPDGGLKEPVRPFEDTFNAEQVLMEKFFPEKLTQITAKDLGVAESRGYNSGYTRGYLNGFLTGVFGLTIIILVTWLV